MLLFLVSGTTASQSSILDEGITNGCIIGLRSKLVLGRNIFRKFHDLFATGSLLSLWLIRALGNITER